MIVEVDGVCRNVGKVIGISHEDRGVYGLTTKDQNTSIIIDLDNRRLEALFGMIGHDVQQNKKEQADEEIAMQLIASTYENISIEKRVF